MDFSHVKAMTIPEGNVLRILSGSTVLWKKTGLPAEYQEVEYLESTGTQYIDTGIVLNNGCEITLDFLMAESAVNRIAYGWRRKGAYTNSYQAYITSNTRKIRQIIIGRSSEDGTYPQSFEYDVRNKVLIDSVDEQVLVNGIVTDCGADFSNGKAFDKNGSSEYHPYLFALNNAGTPLAIAKDSRIYGYSVQYEGKLLQSFVPCYRKIDKVAGMYDIVNGVFYTNAGTGEFNVGADVIVLPADYQRVEYLESTGTQYIDTGIKGTENTKVDIEFQIMGNLFLPFGARRGATTDAFAIWSSNGNVGSGLRIGFDGTAGYTGPAATRDKYHIVFGKEGAFVNGTKVWTPSNYTSFETPGTLLVFGYRATSAAISRCSMKLFALRLWENNVLARGLVPCYRKIDNVAGMYDVVNGVFYQNAGTGSFTVGPDV